MNLRGNIDNSIDDIQNRIASVLNNLENVKNEAEYDVEAMSEANIMDLQGTILDAIDDLNRLYEDLE